MNVSLLFFSTLSPHFVTKCRRQTALYCRPTFCYFFKLLPGNNFRWHNKKVHYQHSLQTYNVRTKSQIAFHVTANQYLQPFLEEFDFLYEPLSTCVCEQRWIRRVSHSTITHSLLAWLIYRLQHALNKIYDSNINQYLKIIILKST